MPRGFSKIERERINTTMIEAAMERLNTTGVTKTTVEDFTNAAHISKGAFYKFYPSKEALFFRIFEIYEASVKKKFTVLLMNMDIQDPGKGLVHIIRELLFSSEMQDFIQHDDDFSYVLRVVEPEVVHTHYGKDMEFMDAAYAAAGKLGLTVTMDKEKALAYVQSLFLLFMGRKSIPLKYFEDVIDGFIEKFVDELLKPGR